MVISAKHSTFWTWVEYAFYAFFATFPFLHYSLFLYSGTSTRSINLVIFAALLGIALGIWLFKKGNTVSLVKSVPLGVLALYFVSLVISGITGLSPHNTFWSMATRMTGVWYLLSLGLLMLMLFAVIADEAKHRRLILIIILSTALYSVLNLLGKDGFGWIFNYGRNEGFTFGNTSFAAMYIFGAFLLSLYYVYQAEVRKWWMYALPIVLLINPNILNPRIWTGDFSSGLVGAARATTYTIALSVVMLGALWAVSKIRNTVLRERVSYALFGAGALAALFAVLSLLSPGGFVREAYLSQSTAARPLVWEMSQQAVAERPLFGYGTDNFERVFEAHYDNRLLEEEYGNEAWFDRAHNVIIDQMVDNGFVGLALYFLAYLAVLLALLYTALRAAGKRDRALAAILLTYFTLHIVELQTAFDTSISYPMLAFMFVSAAVLYHRARSSVRGDLALPLNRAASYGVGALLIAFFSWSLFFGALPITKVQLANAGIRKVGSSEARIPQYATLFTSPMDAHGFLWRTSTDFQRGIATDPSVLQDPKKVEGLKRELAMFESYYKEYLKENPAHFRAHLNLADILIYQMLFGVNKLEEAQGVLDAAIMLVPQSPQPYWMKAVAYVYMQKFALAREYAQKALDVNPKIKQSGEVARYVENSIRTFPEIDLFFFKQI